MVKQIIENAIAQIETKRQQEIAAARQKANQEVIVPHNNEVDTLLRKAIEELQTAYTQRLSEMSRIQEQEKAALVGKADKDKREFAETAYAQAVAVINVSADNTIAKLRAMIEEQGV